MTKFLDPKFNSRANTKQYADNYDRIFKKKSSSKDKKVVKK